jgi:hypothetical protein
MKRYRCVCLTSIKVPGPYWVQLGSFGARRQRQWHSTRPDHNFREARTLEFVAFTIVGIGLYLLSDAMLSRWEGARGAPFANRSVVFFAILLSLALVTFGLIRAVVGA